MPVVSTHEFISFKHFSVNDINNVLRYSPLDQFYHLISFTSLFLPLDQFCHLISFPTSLVLPLDQFYHLISFAQLLPAALTTFPMFYHICMDEHSCGLRLPTITITIIIGNQVGKGRIAGQKGAMPGSSPATSIGLHSPNLGAPGAGKFGPQRPSGRNLGLLPLSASASSTSSCLQRARGVLGQ